MGTSHLILLLLGSLFISSVLGVAVIVVEGGNPLETGVDEGSVSPKTLLEFLTSSSSTSENKTLNNEKSAPQIFIGGDFASVEGYSLEENVSGGGDSGSFEDFPSGESELQVDASGKEKVNNETELIPPQKVKRQNDATYHPEVQESRRSRTVVAHPGKDLKASATGYGHEGGGEVG